MNNWIATFNFNLECLQNKRIWITWNELEYVRIAMERTKSYIHFIRVILLFYEKNKPFFSGWQLFVVKKYLGIRDDFSILWALLSAENNCWFGLSLEKGGHFIILYGGIFQSLICCITLEAMEYCFKMSIILWYKPH